MKLRELQIKDAPFMLEWMRDKDINRFFAFDSKSVTLESAKNYIENAQGDKENRHYAIVDDEDQYMGTISLKKIDAKNKNAEYAISLRTCAQGKGYASFATKKLLEIAFVELDLFKVYLNVLSYNKRAIAFYEKIGFSYEGEFKHHLVKDGEFQNLKWYAKFREEK